jgi:hypothetical protein
MEAGEAAAAEDGETSTRSLSVALEAVSEGMTILMMQEANLKTEGKQRERP